MSLDGEQIVETLGTYDFLSSPIISEFGIPGNISLSTSSTSIVSNTNIDSYATFEIQKTAGIITLADLTTKKFTSYYDTNGNLVSNFPIYIVYQYPEVPGQYAAQNMYEILHITKSQQQPLTVSFNINGVSTNIEPISVDSTGVILNASNATINMKYNDTITTNVSGITFNSGFTLSVDPPTLLKITNLSFQAIGVGIGILSVSQPGDDFYAINSNYYLINIVKINQDFFYIEQPYSFIFDTSNNLLTTKQSISGAITFSSITPNVCTNDNNRITTINTGDCTINAVHAGNNFYNSISSIVTVPVLKANQKPLSINPVSNLLYKEIRTLTISGGTTNLRPEFTSSDPNVCKIAGDKIEGVNTGTCTINAIMPGNTNYHDISANLEVSVYKINQEALVISPVSLAYQSSTLLAVTGGSTTNEVVYTSNNLDICTVSGNILYGDKAGTTTVTAFKAGDNNYFDISGTIQVTVTRIAQPSVSLNSLETLKVNQSTPVPITISGILETDKFNTILLSDGSNCRVDSSNNLLYALSEGSCTIQGRTTETTNYNITNTPNLNVKIIRNQQQDISFNQPDTLFYNASTLLNANGGSSINDFYYTTDNINCSVSGNVLYGLNAGTCAVTATRPEDNNYYSLTNTINVSVLKANQFPLSINPVSNLLYKETRTLTISGGTTNKIPVFTSSDSTICKINDNKIEGVNVGTCTINALMSGDDNYNDISANLEVSVFKINQESLVINSVSLAYQSSTLLSVTGGSTSNDIIYISNSPEICTVSGNILYGDKAGIGTVTAIRPGDNNYFDVSGIIQVTVTKLLQPYVSLNSLETLKVNQSTPIPITISGILETDKFNTILLSDGSNCRVDSSNNSLYALSEGNCTIQGITNETINYNSTKTNNVNVNIIRNQQQDISFNQPEPLYYNASTLLNAIGGSSINDFYYTTDNVNCSISGNVLYGLNSGTCAVTAVRPDDNDYYTISNTINVSVLKATQKTLSINPVYPLFYRESSTLTITGGTTDKVPIYTSSDSNICKIDGNKIEGVNVGTCTINAVMPGDDNYNDISANLEVSVYKINQEALLIAPVSLAYQSSTLLSVTGGSTTNEVVYTSNNPEICTVSGNILYGDKAGTTTVNAFKAGDNNYFDISGIIQVTVLKIAQPYVSLNSLDTLKVNKSNPIPITISGILETDKFNTVLLSDGSNCQVDSSNNLLYALSEGSCTIQGITNETTNYGSTKTNNVNVNIIRNQQQDISFNQLDTLYYNGSTLLSATGGSSVNDFYYTTDDLYCSISGNILYGLNAGICPVTLVKPEDNDYYTISNTINISVLKATQKELSINPVYPLFYKSSATLTTTGGSTNKVPIFTSSDSTICKIDGNKIEGVNVGTCTINALIEGNDNYNDISANIEVSVYKINQDPLDSVQVSLTYQSSTLLSVTGGSTTNEVIYISNNPEICTISGNILYGDKAGTATVTAIRPGDNNYFDVSGIIQVTVLKISQPYISLNSLETLKVNQSMPVPITISGILETDKFNTKLLSDSSNCQVDSSNNLLYALSEGNCIIQGITNETTNYNTTTTPNLAVIINRNQQPDIIFNQPYSLYYNGSTILNATGGASVNDFIYDTTSKACSVSGNVLYGLEAGTCTVTAIKPEDNDYYTISSTIDITVYKSEQSPLIINPVYPLFYKETSVLSTTGGSTNKVPIFTSSDTNICKINGAQIEGINVGTCIVNAIMEGDNNYNDISANIEINVYKINQEPIIITTQDLIYNGISQLSVTGGSIESSVIFISSDPSICSISGNIAYGNKTGECIITAIKDGNNNYYDVSGSINIKVSKIKQGKITIENITENNQVTVDRERGYLLKPQGILENANYSFISENTNICNIDTSNNVYMKNAGECIVKGTTSDTDNYLSSDIDSLKISVSKNENEIIINPYDTLYYKSSIDISGYSKNTDKPIIFTSNNSSCIVNQNSINAVEPGVCNITAFQEENDIYKSTEKIFDISINRIKQSGFVIPPIYNLLYEESQNVITAGGNTNNKPIIISRTENTCTISDNIIYGVKPGSCTLYATLSGDAGYFDTESELTLDVYKQNQNNFRIEDMIPLEFQQRSSLTISGFRSSGKVIYSSDNDNCRIEDNQVYGNKVGTCTITAYMPGDDYFNDISSSINLNIIKIKQPKMNIILENTDLSGKIKVDGEHQLTVSGALESPTITYNILNNTDVCKINGNLITGLKEGKCTVQGITSETENFSKTETDILEIEVIRNEQYDVSFNELYPLLYSSNIYLSSYGGNTDKTVYYATDSSNCSISGNMVLGTNVGSCKVDVIKPGDNKYYDKINSIIINVNKGIQQPLYFTPLYGLNTYSTVFLSTFGGSSKGDVRFISSDTNICTISGNLAYGVKPGKCVITAIKEGDDQYNEVSTITDLVVLKVRQSNLTLEPLYPLFKNSEATLKATGGSSNNDIIFTTDNENIAIIKNNNTIFGVNNGAFNLIITKRGDETYEDEVLTVPLKINKPFQQNLVLMDISNNVLIANKNDKFTLTVSGALENPDFKFEIISQKPENVCYFDTSNQLVIQNSGKCSIQATSLETKNFGDTKTNILELSILNPFRIGTDKPFGYIDEYINLSYIGGMYDSTVSYISNTPNTCIIEGNTLLGKSIGTCTITGNSKNQNNKFDLSTSRNLAIRGRRTKPDLKLTSRTDYEILNEGTYLVEANQPGFRINVLSETLSPKALSPGRVCHFEENRIFFPLRDGSCNVQLYKPETDTTLETSSPIYTFNVRNKIEILTDKAKSLVKPIEAEMSSAAAPIQEFNYDYKEVPPEAIAAQVITQTPVVAPAAPVAAAKGKKKPTPKKAPPKKKPTPKKAPAKKKK